MARDGKKIEEFEIYPRDAKGNRTGRSFPAVLRMTDSFKFVLEVNQLRFEGRTPADLAHQAQMQLENEQDLQWEARILVDPDLEEGRLIFRRVFVARSRDGRDVYRAWRFSGDDERRTGRWNSEIPKTFQLLEGAIPGERTDEARLKDREMEYTSERWQALLKLDEMLAEAHKAVANKLHDQEGPPVSRHVRAYLMYLAQARMSGLPPDGRRWDHPCPHFVAAAAELVRRGFARRRWWIFGPVGITIRGARALMLGEGRG